MRLWTVRSCSGERPRVFNCSSAVREADAWGEAFEAAGGSGGWIESQTLKRSDTFYFEVCVFCCLASAPCALACGHGHAMVTGVSLTSKWPLDETVSGTGLPSMPGALLLGMESFASHSHRTRPPSPKTAHGIHGWCVAVTGKQQIYICPGAHLYNIIIRVNAFCPKT